MTRDQDRLHQSTTAYHTLGRVAPEIANRLAAARAAAAPQAPRRPGAPPAGSDGPADPVHSQVAQLEEHLRRRGGPLHRIALLLGNLDALAEAIDADHRLPVVNGIPFVDRVARLRPVLRSGPVGARLHTLDQVASDIGDQLHLLNETIYDQWRQLWRTGQAQHRPALPPGVAYTAIDDHDTVLDQALLTYSHAASYAVSIAKSLVPYETPEPWAMCACGTDCCPDGCGDRLWTRGRRISERCKKRQYRARHSTAGQTSR